LKFHRYYDLAKKFYEEKLSGLNYPEVEMEDLYEDIESWVSGGLEWKRKAEDGTASRIIVCLKEKKYITRKTDSEGIIYKVKKIKKK